MVVHIERLDVDARVALGGVTRSVWGWVGRCYTRSLKGIEMAKARAKGRGTTVGRTGQPSTRKAVGAEETVKSVSMRSASILKGQMPNWTIVKGASLIEASGDGQMKTDVGPSLNTLRVKFLGHRDAVSGPMLADVDESVKTVRIKPKSGGSLKTADIRNGKVTIVQG